MENGEPARKTRAILFSDIQGYSKLMDEHEALGLKLLDEHNAICVPLIEKHGGKVIKFIGDAIMASFDSALDAVQYGVTVQRLLAERNASRPDIVPLVLRIGIHIGDVVFKDGDVFGEGVNIAARIEPLAEPGGVAISQTVYDMIKARAEIQTVSLGAKELKNISEAVNIYRVVIDAQAGAAPPASSMGWAPFLILFAAALAVGAFSARSLLFRRSSAAQTVASAQSPQVAPDDSDPALKRRRHERDDRWFQQIKPLLGSSASDAEKSRQALLFFDEFHALPGINEGYADELARWLPPGDSKAQLEAVAATPRAVEAAARMRLKRDAGLALVRLTKGGRFASEQARKDFCWKSPVCTNGWLVELSVGQPARDAQGRLVFAYNTAAGVKREVGVSASILGYGPAAEAASTQAGEVIAKDYLASQGYR